MSFRKDNREFEAWQANHCKVVKPDIDYKHHRMKKSAFFFLRATYFRWARKIGDWCPKLMNAPQLLAVGDLHLENFGTWRDADGRLIWGVNDFDEAAVMPYVLDLVRLATSIQLAPSRKITNRQAANALLRGYRKGLDDPRPALLFENKAWLRPYAEPAKGEPEKFWKKVAKYPAHKLPAVIEKTLRARLPKGVNPKSIRRCRILRKGAGSLGRPRYAVVADWDGGQVLREAKALIPSAWTWARNPTASGRSHLITLAKGPHRAPDPSLDVQKKFVFRRIAGDSRKIELGKNAGKKLHLDLLEAMGFDIASIHAAGSVGIDRLKEDLDSRPRSWLNDAATTAAEEVRRDYREWRS